MNEDLMDDYWMNDNWLDNWRLDKSWMKEIFVKSLYQVLNETEN